MNGCTKKCGSIEKTTDGRCLPCRRELYRKIDWKRKGILFRGKPIAYADYEEQLKRQGGRCATCRVLLREGVLRRPDSAHMDHDHVTKEFRGVLCLVCNKTLRVEVTVEVLERMIAYLKVPPAQVVDRREQGVFDDEWMSP